ncbi:FMN-dependent NADH-azoreductase [Chryseobacterium sp. JV558]|uniref:FMN-dependent NADH-azoreductase n=1 Tax=Chryseobacterium sp. JV558 TaxID=2663236 RepID=UPI00299E7634|nr:NAD(P)H-dependent oxidoreductase [Chryseobacterium sp. JV558]MDW9379215.1 FMN-dependent NADH-azoreductase [Chryseobacterium sp. JV558]
MSKKVLHIISSTRGTDSYTIKMGNLIVDKITESEPAVSVDVLDLSKKLFPHLSQDQINGFFTPPEHRTPELAEAIRMSDEAVAQIQEADYIVIGVPMYNFSITSGLKAYLDHIARAKVTFQYSESGSEGLLKGKKAFIAGGSAGLFTAGPNKPFDFAIPYLTHFLSFIGITDVTIFRVEGTAIPGMEEMALNNAIQNIEKAFTKTMA